MSAVSSEAEASEAMYQRARMLDDLDRMTEAEAAYQSVAARYPAREVAGASLWRLGWLAYLRGDLKMAEQRWSKLAAAPGGRSLRLGALYWRGRAVEQLGRSEAATGLYRGVLAEAPRSYYGLLAAQRTKAPERGRAPSRCRPIPRRVLASDPGYARVDLLRRVGLLEDAWLELEDVVQRSVGDTVGLYGFSSAYVQAERYHLALRILRRHLTGVAATGDPAMPRAFWEMLYPFAWRKEMTEAAAAGRPRSVLRGRRRARGVELLSARRVARGGPRPDAAHAGHRPAPGRGARPGRSAAASCSTTRAPTSSSGPRSSPASFASSATRASPSPPTTPAPGVSRQWWQARRTSDIEAFVEMIPFDETRGYVKRVMFSWDQYRRIYASQ